MSWDYTKIVQNNLSPRSFRSASMSLPDTPSVGFTEMVRRHTDSYYGKKRIKSMDWTHRLPQQELELEMKNSLLKTALIREQTVCHALSSTQLDLTATEIKLQEVVDLSERLIKETANLKSQLEEQLKANSALQNEIRMIKDSSCILKETVEEQQLEIVALIEALKLKDSIWVNSSAKLPSKLPDIKTIDGKTDEFIRQLRFDVQREKSKRIEAEDQKSFAIHQYENIEEELKASRAKCTRLEENLLKTDEAYEQSIVGLSAENAQLKADNDKLLNYFRKIEDEMSGKILSTKSDSLTPEIIEDNKMKENDNLHFQVKGIRKFSLEGINLLEGGELSKNPSYLLSPIPRSPVPDTADVVNSYLYITASVVKLHYPEITEVSTTWLIDRVKNAPFYLYHDLMMNFLRQKKREKDEFEAKEPTLTDTIVVSEQCWWMRRLLSITQRIPRLTIVKPKACATKRRSKQILM
jgi:hypothetical protein